MAETHKEAAAAVMAEIAAEEAAKGPSEKKPEGQPILLDALEKLDAPKEGEADKPAAKTDAGKDGEPAKDADGTEEKPAKPRTPADPRLNEVNAKLRQAEKKARDLEAELQRVKGEVKPPTPEEQIRADEREKVRAEEKRNRYLEQGQDFFGVSEFQEAEDKLIAMGFRQELLDLAQEGLTDKQAAKALYRLAFEPPEEIEAFLGKKRAGQAIQLAKLADRRDRGEKEEVEETKVEPKPAPKPVRVSAAPAPITPLNPTAADAPLSLYKEGMTDAEFDDAMAIAKKQSPKLASLMGG